MHPFVKWSLFAGLVALFVLTVLGWINEWPQFNRAGWAVASVFLLITAIVMLWWIMSTKPTWPGEYKHRAEIGGGGD